MALSALLADENARLGAPRYSNGYRTFDYVSDPSTVRYKQFADAARARGITDPNAIDQYALSGNQQWGQQHGIHANENWLERHPWVVGALPAMAGGAAYGLGAAAAGGAAGGGAGAGTANALDAELGAAMGTGAGASGAAGTAGLDEAAMTQAAREQA